jgi:HlyD family secretion protein
MPSVRSTRILISAITVLFALQGCRLPWQDTADPNTISLSGTIEARETNLAFQVSGRIQTLHVDEGDRIRQGDLVAELDDRDYVTRLAQAKAETQAAAASLALLRAGSRAQEIQVAMASVAKAKAELTYAESEVRRISHLVERKLAAQDQLDQARLQKDVARTALRQAEQNLLLLQEGARKEDIQRAEATLSATDAATQTSQQQLEYTKLFSPVDGEISLRKAEQGEVVSSGQPVFSVADIFKPWVRAYLNETDLSRVRLGQDAVVHVDGLPDHAFKGHLTYISPVAEFTPKTVETRALRVDLVYRIKIEVEDPDHILKIGMPADVELSTKQAS